MHRDKQVTATFLLVSVLFSGIGSGSTVTDGSNGCVNDTWRETSLIGAPGPRAGHSAVWTGTEMIVWGGGLEFPVNPGDPYDPAAENTGARYDPASDTWVATGTDGAPQARISHVAVWTGTEMIVWAGEGGAPLVTGGRYDPASDTWTPTSRQNHLAPKAVWSGTEMIFWGGNGPDYSRVGGRYEPINDVWASISEVDAPVGRGFHTAVWTDTEMIIWGGVYVQEPGIIYLNTGGRYCASTGL